MRNETVKLTFVLCIICAVATAALAGVNAVTKGPIESINAQMASEARIEVMTPNGEEPGDYTASPISETDFETLKGKLASSDESAAELIDVYTVEDANGLVGYAITANGTRAFSGRITVMVGIKTDGTIIGAKVTAHAETPGLGARATEQAWIDQYDNELYPPTLTIVKQAGYNNQADSQIHAITSATVTSNAVTAAVNYACEAYTLIEGGN